jgi:hypothetical protein
MRLIAQVHFQIADSLPTKTVPRCSNAAHQTHMKTQSTKDKKRLFGLSGVTNHSIWVEEITCKNGRCGRQAAHTSPASGWQ